MNRPEFDLTLGGLAEPTDHPYEHDPDTDDEGTEFCWCGWTREAHLEDD